MPSHAINSGHPFGEISLLKEVNKNYQLDAYESIFLYKNKHEDLVNVQSLGNCNSPLFRFFDP
jgi:hypothetical protein